MIKPSLNGGGLYSSSRKLWQRWWDRQGLNYQGIFNQLFFSIPLSDSNLIYNRNKNKCQTDGSSKYLFLQIRIIGAANVTLQAKLGFQTPHSMDSTYLPKIQSQQLQSFCNEEQGRDIAKTVGTQSRMIHHGQFLIPNLMRRHYLGNISLRERGVRVGKAYIQ